MNLTKLLGILALFTGSALILGEFWIRDAWLQQTTGMTWDSLRPQASLLFFLGLLALWVEVLTTSDARHYLKRRAKL
jgi:hypothetical protein